MVSHVHGAVVGPSGEGFLLGTHEGVYGVTADGEVSGREGTVVFDAMGFARVGTSLFASGHPLPNGATPTWGSSEATTLPAAGSQSLSPGHATSTL